MRDVLLETDRLCLRRFTEDDLDALAALDGDPEVMRYITGGIPRTRSEIAERILPAYIAYHDESPEFGFFVAEERSTGRFLGWFHFRPYKGNETEIELGYRLIRDVWGQGLATEGSRALILRGFTTLDVPRVVATAFKANAASQRVMEKVGLRYEEDFLYPEKYLPGWSEDARRGVKYGVDREAWLAAESAG